VKKHLIQARRTHSLMIQDNCSVCTCSHSSWECKLQSQTLSVIITAHSFNSW